MPNAARRAKRRQAREREQAALAAVETERLVTAIEEDEKLVHATLPPFPDLSDTKDNAGSADLFCIGDPREDRGMQTEPTDLMDANQEELHYLRWCMALCEDVDDDAEEDSDDEKLTEEMRLEIQYLNSLSPEELRMEAEMEYDLPSDLEYDVHAEIDNTNHNDHTNTNWLDEMD